MMSKRLALARIQCALIRIIPDNKQIHLEGGIDSQIDKNCTFGIFLKQFLEFMQKKCLIQDCLPILLKRAVCPSVCLSVILVFRNRIALCKMNQLMLQIYG